MSEHLYFQDLAILTTIVGVVAVAFARFKWPKVLGYIAAGVLMSQYTWGGSFLTDEGTFRVVGQLGVIYLMFTMGLDFSMAQIKRMKAVVMPIALLDTVVMTWVGYTIGTSFFGWGPVPSLFLGVAICDSATTMLAKMIDEMKWGEKPFVRYTLGTSVCEDMICVGLIAIVTGVAQGKGLSLKAAGSSLGALFVFLFAVIVFGMILVPRLLKSVAKRHDDEALLLTIVGLCFFVSWMALKFDFSLAIGAFLVGVIGASSEVRQRLAELVSPLKTLYAAIFFVSIGLLLDPAACFRHLPTIVALSIIVMVVKFFNVTLGALLTGESVRTAVQMGMSLAQIGEFAFMVAILYSGATGDETCPMFDIVVSVSVVTTLINPTMIRLSEPAGRWVEEHLPALTRRRLETYRGFVAKFQALDHAAEIHKIVRSCFLQLGVVVVLNLAVAICCIVLDRLDYSKFSVFFDTYKRFILCLLTNLFIVAMFIPAGRVGRVLGRAIAHVVVGEEETKWQQSLRSIVSLTVLIGVLILLFGQMWMINVHISPHELWARCTIYCILLLAGAFGGRWMVKAVDRAGTRFVESLSAEERRAKIGSVLTFSIPSDHVSRLVLESSSPAIGETIGSLNIRAKTGAVIAAIEREGGTLRVIGPQTDLRVGDTIVAVGDGPQIAALKDLLGIVS